MCGEVMCVDMLVGVCVKCVHVSVNQFNDFWVDGALSWLPGGWKFEWFVGVGVGVVKIVQ